MDQINKSARRSSADPELIPFYSPKPTPDLSSRDELFNALLPKVYAFYRPRRHSYGVGLELATLLVYVLNIPVPELQAILSDRAVLKTFLLRIVKTSKEYDQAIIEGRGEFVLVVKKRPGGSGSHYKDAEDWMARIIQVDPSFLFKAAAATTMCWLDDAVVRECLSGFMADTFCKEQMENAQRIHLDWFCEYWNRGRDAAKILLRARAWSADDFRREEEYKADKIGQFQGLLSTIQSMTAKSVGSTFQTFLPFQRLPAELRVRIWKMTWEPRIVEIQGSIHHTFEIMGDKNGYRDERFMENGIDTRKWFCLECHHWCDLLKDEGLTIGFIMTQERRDRNESVPKTPSEIMRRLRELGLRETMFHSEDSIRAQAVRFVDEEDALDVLKWSAEPVYGHLKRLLNQGARTEAEFKEIMKGENSKFPLLWLGRGLPITRHADELARGCALHGEHSQPSHPAPLVIRIGGILSKIQHGQRFDEADYEWPQIPSYELVETIFRKIENGKKDEEILGELEENPTSSRAIEDTVSFWMTRREYNDWLRAKSSRDSLDEDEDEDQDQEHGNESILFSSPAPLPASLHVCRESRAEAQMVYDCAFNNRSLNYPGIYINYNLDTVLCVSETFGNHRLRDRQQSGDEYGWVAGFDYWDRETREKIQRIAIDDYLFFSFNETHLQCRSFFTESFPKLQDVIVTNYDSRLEAHEGMMTSQPNLRYELVGFYKTHLAFNAQYPNHDNDFFRNPFKRYWDAEQWIPGLDAPRDSLDEEWHRGGGSRDGFRTNFPGYVPVGPEYVKLIQKLPVTFGAPFDVDQRYYDEVLSKEWKENAQGEENPTLRVVRMRRGGFADKS